MFRAFIDESGFQCDVFAVSAFVGAEREWELFCQDWEPIITAAGVTYHAAECEGGYGEFAGWSREKRDALNIALIDCLAKRQIFGVGMSAIVQDFREVMPTSPETLWRDLYVELLEIVLIQSVNRMVDRPPGQPLAVRCHQQD